MEHLAIKYTYPTHTKGYPNVSPWYLKTFFKASASSPTLYFQTIWDDLVVDLTAMEGGRHWLVWDESERRCDTNGILRTFTFKVKVGPYLCNRHISKVSTFTLKVNVLCLQFVLHFSHFPLFQTNQRLPCKFLLTAASWKNQSNHRGLFSAASYTYLWTISRYWLPATTCRIHVFLQWTGVSRLVGQ